MAKGKFKSARRHLHPSAFWGLALLLPFLTVNGISSQRIEPFFSWMRVSIFTGQLEYIVYFGTMLLIPVGIYFAIHPMLKKVEKGEQKYYVLNILVAIALSMLFIFLLASTWPEIYRCDILRIPYCD